MLEKFYIVDDLYGSFLPYNVKFKNFTDGTKIIKKSSYTNFLGHCGDNHHNGSYNEEQLELSKQRNLRRMKELVYDIAYENGCIQPWEYFGTITFDDNKVNALDYDKAKEKLKNWLDTMRRKSSDMRYLIIAELHKSGRIHFHGLFSNVNWQLTEAINPHTNKPIVKNGSKIYNIKDFNLGFTTVSKIKDMDAVTFYITKYITKELLDIKNKKHYWASRNLKKPSKQYFNCLNDELFFEYLNKNNFNIDRYNSKVTCESVTDYYNVSKIKNLT